MRTLIIAITLLFSCQFVPAQEEPHYKVDFILWNEQGKIYVENSCQTDQSIYPPGPTMYLFTALAALEEKVVPDITTTIQYKCPHPTTKKKIKCQKDLKTALNEEDIFFFLKLEELITKKKLKHYSQTEHYGNGMLPKVWTELNLSEQSLHVSPKKQIEFLRKLNGNAHSSFLKENCQAIKNTILTKDSLDFKIFSIDGGIGSLKNFHDWKIGILEQHNNTYFFALHIKFDEIQSKEDLNVKHQELIRRLRSHDLYDQLEIEKQARIADSIAAAKADTIYTLQHFYSKNFNLANETDEIFENLTNEQRVGQLIIAAGGKWGDTKSNLTTALNRNELGGILLLKGEKNEFKKLIKEYDKANKSLPLIYCADAEPSLINRKISGIESISKTNSLKTDSAVISTTQKINTILKDIGILYNFAPDCDLGVNRAIIGNRAFGKTTKDVVHRSALFVNSSTDSGIVTTAKHFPGHGLVKGDSHHQLVFIDGELKEKDTYTALIDSGVISIMIGHIAVENNSKYTTNGQPASISKKIVTDLLKTEMGFEGIIITDGMGMGAVKSIPNATLKAIEAGCDIVLMPSNIAKTHQHIVEKYLLDHSFKEKVDLSVKKVIRLKLCLGLL